MLHHAAPATTFVCVRPTGATTSARSDRAERPTRTKPRELADRSRGAWIDPRLSATTFEDWAKCWRESASGSRPKTLVRADDAIRLHLVPAFGSRPLGSLTPLDVQKLVNELAQRFAPATTRTYYAVLRAILNGAAECRPDRALAVPRNQAAAGRPEAAVIVGPDDIHRLADAIAPEYRAMVFVAGELGFRWGECAGLQVRDVDVLRRTVTVRLNVGEVRGALDIGEPKTNAGPPHRGCVGPADGGDRRAPAPAGPDRSERGRVGLRRSRGRSAALLALPSARLAARGPQGRARGAHVPRPAPRRRDGLGGRWDRSAHRPAPSRARDARLVLELYVHATTEADRAAADLMGARLFGNGDRSTRVARHRRAMESPGERPHHALAMRLTCTSTRAGEETRTPGLLITSELLYRLSYSGDGGDSITAVRRAPVPDRPTRRAGPAGATAGGA